MLPSVSNNLVVSGDRENGNRAISNSLANNNYQALTRLAKHQREPSLHEIPGIIPIDFSFHNNCRPNYIAHSFAANQTDNPFRINQIAAHSSFKHTHTRARMQQERCNKSRRTGRLTFPFSRSSFSPFFPCLRVSLSRRVNRRRISNGWIQN